MNKYIIFLITIFAIGLGVLFLVPGDKIQIPNLNPQVLEDYKKLDTPKIIDNQATSLTPQDPSLTPQVENKIMQDENKKEMSQLNATVSRATLNTNKGKITIEFFSKETPKTVANFIKLSQENFYDGIKFHRVIKGFMIQGGDPLTKDDSKMNYWGQGGPGYAFEDEIHSKNKNNKGTISMANSGPNTNGSQFFINVNDNNFLDTKHTVFGKVINGMDVVAKIENTPTSSDRPIEAVTINSISLE
ncbi:MAG: peptidylprolyl isomerase [Patescibacteria group bacterium]